MKDAMEVLLHRRSVRRYTDGKVPREDLDRILEAGTYAPTGGGRQKVRIVALQDPDDVSAVKKLNAAVMGRDTDPYYGAGTIVIVFAEADNGNAQLDGAAVCTNMLNAVDALGLGACWINRSREVFAGEEGKKLLKKWGLPEDLIGVASFSLGYTEGDYPAPAPRRPDYVTLVL